MHFAALEVWGITGNGHGYTRAEFFSIDLPSTRFRGALPGNATNIIQHTTHPSAL